MSQDKPFIWKSSLGGPEVGRDRVSGDPQGGANSVSQVGRGSAMLLACQLCGVGLRKGTMASACLDARYVSFSQYATGAFQAATPVLEFRGSES